MMEIADNTIRRIKECRADANYGKKKHSNASDRVNRYHHLLCLPVVVITVGLGTAFFGTLSEDFPTFLKWIGGVAGFVSAILAGLQNHFNFPRIVEGHRSIASHYRSLAKKCSNTIAAFEDGIINATQLSEKLTQLSEEYDQISCSSEVYKTNESDYLKAKTGINKGEEQYTEIELETRE